MIRFNKNYFLLAFLIFWIEVFIALYVHDAFVRPYIGDVLVVILIYCFVKSFFDCPVFPVSLSVLLFSFAIETLQYFNGITLLGLENSSLARTFIGTSFAWLDLLTYVIGIVIVLVVEKMVIKKT
ncbi:ribosomal maturation YjgA family protein [Flavobacterium cellulosilyticum]|uniref:DUF2809 domain-containing protein n=1 Tax=Flavobacterium cellulosilyticum TaxID=2541731 RepID=A0A4R5CKC3_9FLAO|nr:DUF2809 domain-containing protein [Flavobacterium cellulosilyticum]TDD99619.1 DUF2809 domain-containing protein [Flavobacterium cellulosilyticum]